MLYDIIVLQKLVHYVRRCVRKVWRQKTWYRRRWNWINIVIIVRTIKDNITKKVISCLWHNNVMKLYLSFFICNYLLLQHQDTILRNLPNDKKYRNIGYCASSKWLLYVIVHWLIMSLLLISISQHFSIIMQHLVHRRLQIPLM